MRKIQIFDHTEKANDIQLERIEIVTDTAKPDKVEIYMLDELGEREEGGEFSKDEFMNLVRNFYDQYF